MTIRQYANEVNIITYTIRVYLDVMNLEDFYLQGYVIISLSP